MLPHQWNATLYDSRHSFVSELAADLVEILSPQPGESILDLGCGTGYLTHKIADCGAKVIGIDSSAAMIAQAKMSYPHLHFEVADARNLPFSEQFDGVFSNAVLHWIKEAEQVVAEIHKVLKPGGRFVAEFGGKGNIAAIMTAIDDAILTPRNSVHRASELWYFPSIGEYGTLLEKFGFHLNFATLFDRPTPLEDGEQGIRNWLKMFASSFFSELPEEEQGQILTEIENQLRPVLYRDETWFADYKRLRVVAVKASSVVYAQVLR